MAVRLYHLCAEVGIPSRDALAYLKARGVDYKSPSSVVDPPIWADVIRDSLREAVTQI